ncbi:conserved hypothetical protein [Leishmania major strain Friedlin]|uniref:rRNA maturation factor n=1 Tax=Leishmania major TaxID=5664 RepID=Q4Q2L4_LEIMA|nr:conserved hypothetical protein [Leishmania major strain Friedlin]CAG9582207.1 Uncharacterized_protein_family_UPF0054_-_putative [Leishmania major strain Friedlin]CAJ08051.1 conserved hypothetical protein [Leishmania major strain Friedlin]|eukprot:XP_001686434.1 conserved hypothetical protein [Leishmania major strain Friedlin]
MKTFRYLTITGDTITLRRGARHVMHLLLTLERAPYDTRLNLEFVSLAHMRQLNYKYKGLDRPTDVLTFAPAGEADSFVNDLLFGDFLERGDGDKGTGATLTASPTCAAAVGAGPNALTQSIIRGELVDLGNIFVSLDYMRLRCRRYPSTTLPLAPYLHAALVHATLHALGYDHTSRALLQQMARREQQLGRQLAMIARQHPRCLPPLNIWDSM